ncbi:hypothetical protein [Fodinibius sp. Rm-B-1B1-1]|uniref:hypothetical protein n=1 Tax=Fodinibius alkaliphilus TaxID=3140241 RepID=UPI00315A9D47
MAKNIFKSVGAVITGFLVIVVFSVGTDAVLKAAGILPYDHMFVSTGLILSVIFYRAVYSLIGCYITAKIAPHSPMKHALALGLLGVVISSVGAVMAADLGPAWYAWTLVIIAMPIAWLGGKLYQVLLDRDRLGESIRTK